MVASVSSPDCESSLTFPKGLRAPAYEGGIVRPEDWISIAYPFLVGDAEQGESMAGMKLILFRALRKAR